MNKSRSEDQFKKIIMNQASEKSILIPLQNSPDFIGRLINLTVCSKGANIWDSEAVDTRIWPFAYSILMLTILNEIMI